jgi:hypothetical protein
MILQFNLSVMDEKYSLNELARAELCKTMCSHKKMWVYIVSD